MHESDSPRRMPWLPLQRPQRARMLIHAVSPVDPGRACPHVSFHIRIGKESSAQKVRLHSMTSKQTTLRCQGLSSEGPGQYTCI